MHEHPGRPADLWGENHHHDAAALLCVDDRHRYDLTRDFDGPGVPPHFCMFNPSTTTAVADDANLRRCLGYARHLEALRMRTDHRKALTRRRVQTVDRLQALLADLLPGQGSDLTTGQAKARLASVRPRDTCA